MNSKKINKYDYSSLLKKAKLEEKNKNFFDAFFIYYKIILRSENRNSRNSYFHKKAIYKHNQLFKKTFFNGKYLIPIKENRILNRFKKIENQINVFKKQIGIIKYPNRNEKGIIFINFEKNFEYFMNKYNLEKVSKKYAFLLMPAWRGFHPAIYGYIGKEIRIYFGVSNKNDYIFLKNLKTNIKPIFLSHADLIKLNYKKHEKKYDICTIGYADSYKRYSELIRFISKIKDNEKFRIFFASKKDEITDHPKNIRKIAKKYGLKSKIETGWLSIDAWHKRIAESKVFILNSEQEGGARVLAESLFANTCIMMNSKTLGPNLSFFNKQTGVLYTKENFEKKLKDILKNYKKYSPRKWAKNNIGCYNMVKKLNNIIKKDSLKNGEKWTEDIEQISYTNEIIYENRSRFPNWEKKLKKYRLDK